jgi:hypothetical protein
MGITRVHVQRLALCTALAAALASPVCAQSQLNTSEARAFLGNWIMSITSDVGAMNLQLNIRDEAGKVGAQFGAPEMGPMAEVTDITKAGEQLIMNLLVDAQGQQVDVSLAITPAGDALTVDLSAAGGAFVTSAQATRAAS